MNAPVDELVVHGELCAVADDIAQGAISSEALTRVCLARLERFGPELNAIVSIDAAAALEAARRIDLAQMRGEDIGRLGGVPLAHKDVFYRAGRVCASGSKIRRDFVPGRTATVLARLEAAGAVNLGALSMSEFALSPTGYNEHYGHGRNPWNTAHCSGGSSSGSGAAVAARLVFGSLGSDTGGSIRYPAAMCGVTGLKPTYGRVSRAAVMPLAWTLDCVGPLARSALDCARLLSVIAGADPADGHALPVPVPDYEESLNGKIRGLRIAVPRPYYYDAVDDQVRRALEQSLTVLREQGAVIVETAAPDMALVNAMMQLVMSVEAATLHRRWLAERPQDYADQVRARIEPGFCYPATRYAEALALRAKIAQDYLSVAMRGADLLHLPAVPVTVPTIEQTSGGSPADVARAIDAVTHCVRAINYLGLPAIAVPAGFSSNGLPIGFQLVGRHFDEATLLRVADAYQRVTDWHKRVPPMAL